MTTKDAKDTHYVADVKPTDDGRYAGRVVDTTGKYQGFTSYTPTADEAAGDAIHVAERLNASDTARPLP